MKNIRGIWVLFFCTATAFLHAHNNNDETTKKRVRYNRSAKSTAEQKSAHEQHETFIVPYDVSAMEAERRELLTPQDLENLAAM